MERDCSIPDCCRPAQERGWCHAHYLRWYRHGNPLGGRAVRYPGQLCSIEGCDKAVACRGYCSAHYFRWSKHGDPMGGITGRNEARQYFYDVVLPYDGDECLTWPYAKKGKGYAQLRLYGRQQGVHRAVCIEVNGPPPTPEHHAAHSCGKGHLGCVTKRHLRWATPAENEADKITHGTRRGGLYATNHGDEE